MESSELAKARAEVAEEIISRLGHQVCEGMRQANWYVKELGAMCTLFYYDERRDFDEEEGEVVVYPTPFYLFHALSKRGNEEAVVRIDFNADFSKPQRATAYEPGNRPNDIDVEKAKLWADDAMSAALLPQETAEQHTLHQISA